MTTLDWTRQDVHPTIALKIDLFDCAVARMCYFKQSALVSMAVFLHCDVLKKAIADLWCGLLAYCCYVGFI